MARNFYQPEYFLKFRCTGSDCPYSCCDLWTVYWEKPEYDRLLSPENTNEELRRSIEENILADMGEGLLYKVKLCEDGRCPFHNRETDLCDIQKELGEGFLGETCRNYPRQYLMVDDNIFRHCMTSCPAVIKLLMHDKKAITMEEVPVRSYKNAVRRETPVKFAKAPYLQYRRSIIDFYSWLFTSKKDIETALLMGTLAARSISDSASGGFSMNIPPVLAHLKDEWKSNSPDIHAENVHTDYKLKRGYIDRFLHKIQNMPFDLNALIDGDSIDAEKYSDGKNKFYSAVSNPDIALNNIAMNIFLNLFTILDLVNCSFFNFYTYFILSISTVLFLAYTSGYTGNDIENDFIKATSVLCRKLVHNSKGSNQIMDFAKKFRTPEQIAIIIK